MAFDKALADRVRSVLGRQVKVVSTDLSEVS